MAAGATAPCWIRHVVAVCEEISAPCLGYISLVMAMVRYYRLLGDRERVESDTLSHIITISALLLLMVLVGRRDPKHLHQLL